MKNSTFALSRVALIARSMVTPGAQKDLAKSIDQSNVVYGFTQTTFDAGIAHGFDWDAIIALPQKQVFRAMQFVNATVSGNRLNFDYTHARILCAMRLAGKYDLTSSAIAHLAAGSRSDAVNTRGITSSAVNRMFSRSHKMSTVLTKVSNMTGCNGWSQIIGATWGNPGERDHTLALNDGHSLMVAFFALIDGSTEGQIDAMNEKGIK